MEYRVVYEQIEDGHWMARIPEVRACYTQGRSIRNARKMIRDALAVALLEHSEDEARAIAEAAEFVEEIKLPRDTSQVVRGHVRALDRAERSARELSEARQRAVRELIAAGYSMRDTAEILGISHQRVQQLSG